MKTEYEIKILNIDIPAIINKLAELGFIKAKQQTFRRYVYKQYGLNLDDMPRLTFINE